jgi:predicted amidohydrolase YtcJ
VESKYSSINLTMRICKNLSLLSCFIFLTGLTPVLAQPADIILTNGKIFTGDSVRLYVQALAIRGNKILETGTNASIQKLSGPRTKKIDLKGKTVVPGFNDAHDHLGWLIPVGQSFFTEFSVPGPTKAAVIDSLQRLVKKAAPGQWIQGTIGLTVFNDTCFRRRLLDSIAPHHPVSLMIMWGHGMILNSQALKAVHISDTEPDPLSGWYERLPGTNILTGALYEGSEFPAWQALTLSEPRQLIQSLRSHAAEELAFGITTVQNMSATLQGNAARRIFALADLPVRTRIIAMPASTAYGRSLKEWTGDKYRVSSLSYVSGIKYVIDGTTLEQTALMTTAYPGRKDWYGRLNFPLDTIRQILKEALASDRQLMMHIVGDSTTRIVLNLMKQLAGDDQWKSKRVRLEHGTGIRTAADIKNINDMGIILVHTPQYGMRLPLRSMLESGVHIAIGPDDMINPFLSIMTVTSGQADPNQNLTREQAVMAYTKGSAYAEFAEEKKGALVRGMLADLAVLSQDIFTIPAAQLPATKSLITIVDGKIVH